MAMTLLTRRDPFAEFDAMIRRAFPTRTVAGVPATRVGFVPAAEIVRDGDDAVITLDTPGLDFARDISVELDGASLIISGERRDARAEGNEESGRVLTEVRYGAFKRSFTLPEHVTAEAVSAAYDAGVLTVRVAGAYAGTQPRKITVTAGKPVETTGLRDDAHAADDVVTG